MRNVVENQVDFTESRNLIIAAIILVSALGFNAVGGVTFHVAGTVITLSGLAIAAISGIVLNAVLPATHTISDPIPTGIRRSFLRCKQKYRTSARSRTESGLFLRQKEGIPNR